MVNMKVKYIYLALCVFGIALPYSQLIPIILENGFSINMVIDQLFVNKVSTLFAFDLFVTAVVFIFFALYEGFKLKMKYIWIPIIASFLVGASLGFPLFLYMRESHIEKKVKA